MIFLIRAAALLGIALLAMPAAYAAHERAPCDGVNRETVATLFGRITSADVHLSGGCEYVTEWHGRKEYFRIVRLTDDVPESDYPAMTIRVAGHNEFIDVPGMGEKTIINATTQHLVMRQHGVIYTMRTGTMPCGRLAEGAPGRDEERVKCRARRMAALTQLGAELAR